MTDIIIRIMDWTAKITYMCMFTTSIFSPFLKQSGQSRYSNWSVWQVVSCLTKATRAPLCLAALVCHPSVTPVPFGRTLHIASSASPVADQCPLRLSSFLKLSYSGITVNHNLAIVSLQVVAIWPCEHHPLHYLVRCSQPIRPATWRQVIGVAQQRL